MCIATLQKTNPGIAPEFDSICPKLIINSAISLKSWLRGFFSFCLCHLRIPNVRRRDLVVALVNSSKPREDSKGYRSSSLLCVPYKILERFIHSYVEPIMDSMIPAEQVGFWRGWSIVDQAILMTRNIEDCFEANGKADIRFIDLIAAYETVWHRGLTCTLLRLLPDKHINTILSLSSCNLRPRLLSLIFVEVLLLLIF